MNSKNKIIELLNLKPLPDEGGYYRETFRSKNAILSSETQRSIKTAIYYLISQESYSLLHRLGTADEIFHFYLGGPVELIQIKKGKIKRTILGHDLLSGQQLQVVVPAGIWQGARILGEHEWALLGTTVAPGFEFSDFELAKRDELIERYPDLKNEIVTFT
jgi:predicted cupin superfamily sugar epimerase